MRIPLSSLAFMLSVASPAIAYGDVPELTSPELRWTSESTFDSTPALEPTTFDSGLSRSKRVPGTGRRNAGITLTAIGSTFAVAGIGMMAGGLTHAATCNQEIEDCGLKGVAIMSLGTIVGSISLPFVITGIPLWVSGSAKMNRYRAEGGIGLSVSPNGRYTLSLSGRF